MNSSAQFCSTPWCGFLALPPPTSDTPVPCLSCTQRPSTLPVSIFEWNAVTAMFNMASRPAGQNLAGLVSRAPEQGQGARPSDGAGGSSAGRMHKSHAALLGSVAALVDAAALPPAPSLCSVTSECNATLTDIASTAQHVHSAHPKVPGSSTSPSQLSCFLCLREFMSHAELIHHRRRTVVYPDGTVECWPAGSHDVTRLDFWQPPPVAPAAREGEGCWWASPPSQTYTFADHFRNAYGRLNAWRIGGAAASVASAADVRHRWRHEVDTRAAHLLAFLPPRLAVEYVALGGELIVSVEEALAQATEAAASMRAALEIA